MKIINTEIHDLFIIEPSVFKDERGYFFESYSKQKFEALGLRINFVQDNISRSKKGVIRGLHYQAGKYAQGKLCQVLFGKVLDVAVDIRFNSPFFGKYVAVELSEENNKMFWIPPGFAHGFSVLSDEAVFHYKCTNYYDKSSERSIVFNDLQLNIDWRIEEPIVSSKDLQAICFKDISKDFFYKNN